MTAIRGNIDTGDWVAGVPDSREVMLAGTRIHLLHDRRRLGIDPVASGVDVVVSGHSHRPLIEHQAGVLYLNPGSAGPRRFKLPVSVAEVLVENGSVTPRIVELTVGAAKH